MVNDSLLNYVKYALGKGLSENKINELLSSQGWSASEVKEALNLVEAIPKKQKTEPQEAIPLPPKKEGSFGLLEKIKGIGKERCPFCSTILTEKDTFCPDCGRKVKDEPEKEQKVVVVISKDGKEEKVPEEPAERTLIGKVFSALSYFGTVILIIIAIAVFIFTLVNFIGSGPRLEACLSQLRNHYYGFVVNSQVDTSSCNPLKVVRILYLIGMICSGIFLSYLVVIEFYKGFKKDIWGN